MKKNRLLLIAFLLVMTGINTNAQDFSNLKGKKPFSVNGSLSTTADFYSISGKTSTRDPFNYLLSGNVTVTVYDFSMPFSFMYSGQNASYAQPFNRIGFSPQYKWIKAHLGYRSLNFSSYTLAGHSFLGAGIELTPGKFRLAGVYGRFKQKTIPNTANPIDTLYAPTRKGYSVKIGYGSAKNYFDLIFLKIEDDSLSVKLPNGKKLKDLQANTVLGTHFRYNLGKSIVWETEGAVSLLTKNMAEKQAPETDIPILKNLIKTFNLNASTEYSTAWNSSLMYTAKLYSIGVQYRRVAPNFQSFGAYYFNTDIENTTINGKISAFKRKINLSGNIGIQRDNLKQNKASKSARIISMATMNYNSGKIFSFNGSFSNYSINQQAGRVPLNDTIKLYQTNRSINLMPMLTFSRSKTQHVIQLNTMFTNLIDHNRFTASNNEVSSKVAALNYMLNLIPTGTSLMFGFNYMTLSSASMNQTLYGLSTDVGKSFLNGKLNSNISVSANRSEYEGVPGWTNTGLLQINYRISKKHSFRFSFSGIMNNYSDNTLTKDFNEYKTLFSYVYKI